MEDSSYESERSSGESKFGSHAPGASGADVPGRVRFEATVVGPVRFLLVPPGFERVEGSGSSRECDPRRGDLSLRQTTRGLESEEARAGVAAAEVEQLRACVAHPEGVWAKSEARASRLVCANVAAQACILALEEDIEQLRQQHGAKVVRLRTELRTRLRPEGVNPALERSYRDAIRLSRRLALLEDPNFRAGILDSHNFNARMREQLVDYYAPSSSTGHWDR